MRQVKSKVMAQPGWGQRLFKLLTRIKPREGTMKPLTMVLLVALLTLATTKAPAQTAGADAPWPTKAALLAAARKGEFKDYTNEHGDWRTQVQPLVNSVFAVLRSEYGVPPLPQDTACLRSATDEMARSILYVIRGIGDSVTKRPPGLHGAG
jgi:hypothetical protein